MSIYKAFVSLGIIGKNSLCPVPVGYIGQIPFVRPFVRTVKFGEFSYLQTTATRVNITQTLEVINLRTLINLLRRYLEAQPFDSGDPDCKTVLDQLYRAYAEYGGIEGIVYGLCPVFVNGRASVCHTQNGAYGGAVAIRIEACFHCHRQVRWSGILIPLRIFYSLL